MNVAPHKPQVTTQDIAGWVVTMSPTLISSAFENPDADQSYICQIRDYDGHGTVTPWTTLISLKTKGIDSDSNQDGMSDDNAPIGEADLNNDGIADSDQSVMILTLAVGKGRRLMGINIEDCANTIYPDDSKAQAMMRDDDTTCCMEMVLVLIPAH